MEYDFLPLGCAPSRFLPGFHLETPSPLAGEGRATLNNESFEIKANMTILAPAGKRPTFTKTGKGTLRIIFFFGRGGESADLNF